jgi:hypothetical protein
MQITEALVAQDYNAGEIRSGKMESKLLLQGREGRPNNYRLALTTVDDGWEAPRHRHNFDQIRLPLNDPWQFSPKDALPAGWVGYFPEGVYYGPQKRTPGLKMLVAQFGGASGSGFVGRDRRRAGFDALSRKGTIDKGVFTYVDAEGRRHNQDAYEALWENLHGRKLDYPNPRYRDVILMNPAHFDWTVDAKHPGAQFRRLGTFTERELRIGFIRLAAGASLTFGTQPAPEFVFLMSGGIESGGRNYRPYAAAGFDPEDGPAALKAVADSELFWVRLPRF